MAYDKQTWDGTSYVTPSRMNHIEDGIESCSNVEGWTSNGNWNYYKDEEGYIHLYYYEATAVSRNFSTAEGSLYHAGNVTLSYPISVGDIVSANVDIQQGASTCGVTVGSIGTSQIVVKPWSVSNGSKNTRLSLSIIAKGVN